jgi:hypothetical protein
MAHRRSPLSLPPHRSAGWISLRGALLVLVLLGASLWVRGRLAPHAAGARALTALCGDGYCDPLLESEAACYDDCGRCGDGVCTRGAEDVITCYDDCGFEPAVARR